MAGSIWLLLICSQFASSCSCFTTEILEGFDVHRTSGLGDTLKKYGYLTQAIAHYYTLEHPDEGLQKPGVCARFDEFIRRCQDLEKMTVSDVFATQLMQVFAVPACLFCSEGKGITEMNTILYFVRKRGERMHLNLHRKLLYFVWKFCISLLLFILNVVCFSLPY